MWVYQRLTTSAGEGTQYGIRGRGGLVTRAKGKGFGELLQKKRKGFGDGETVVDAEVEKPEEARPCPCGGREEGLMYGQCCGPYHGGTVEPDATTLMSKQYWKPSIKFFKLFAMNVGGTK